MSEDTQANLVFWVVVVGLLSMMFLGLYMSHKINTDTIKMKARTEKLLENIDNMENEMDSLRLIWYETKIALMENAIYLLSLRYPADMLPICKSLRENDEVWMEIINKQNKARKD